MKFLRCWFRCTQPGLADGLICELVARSVELAILRLAIDDRCWYSYELIGREPTLEEETPWGKLHFFYGAVIPFLPTVEHQPSGIGIPQPAATITDGSSGISDCCRVSPAVREAIRLADCALDMQTILQLLIDEPEPFVIDWIRSQPGRLGGRPGELT